MPKVEVDEAEFNRMQALTSVASKIVANPASRKLLEQAHKMVDANASTPTLDAEAQSVAPIKDLEKNLTEQIAALKKEREDEKREATLKSIADKQTVAFAKLRSKGYTDEGIKAIEKLMEDKGLIDVNDATVLFEAANPPPPPSTPSGMTGQAWGFADVTADSDKSIQELIATKGASDSVADRMAIAALNDFRAQAR